MSAPRLVVVVIALDDLREVGRAHQPFEIRDKRRAVSGRRDIAGQEARLRDVGEELPPVVDIRVLLPATADQRLRASVNTLTVGSSGRASVAATMSAYGQLSVRFGIGDDLAICRPDARRGTVWRVSGSGGEITAIAVLSFTDI